MPDRTSATAHIDDLLAAYHAGALPPAEMERVERHLRGCAACQAASQAVALDQLIRSAPAPTVGPELRQRVYARIAAATRAESAHAPVHPLHDKRAARARTGTHAPRPGAGWLEGAAALVVVALLASVFWALPRVRQPTQPGDGSHHGVISATVTTAPGVPAACPPSATSATIPANAIFTSIALTSPTDGWAVGSIMDFNTYASQGLVMRLNHCHWAPVALDLPNIGLSNISMASATEGWAIGNYTDSSASVLLHYYDGAWNKVPLPADPTVAEIYVSDDFSEVQAAGPDNVWLVVDTPKTTQGQMSPMLLLHVVNGQWASVGTPLPILDSLAPLGSNDLWIVGQTSTISNGADTYRFAHYHNGQWTVMRQPAGAELTTLHAVSPTDIWASGYIPNDRNPSASLPIVARYDGASWQVSPQSIPPNSGAGTTAFMLAAGEGWAERTREVFPNGPQNGPPVSLITNVWLETGGQWQILPWPYKDINLMYGMTPVSSGEVWAIGGSDRTLSSTQTGGVTRSSGVILPILLHYANGSWTRYG